MSKKLVFEVSPGGNVRVEASGFSDDACLDATKVFETALAAEVVSRRRTAEADRTSRVSGGQVNVGNN